MTKYNVLCGTLVLGTALLLVPEAQANRPFFTDDAGDGADPRAGFAASALAQLGVVFLFDLFGTGEHEGATLLDR